MQNGNEQKSSHGREIDFVAFDEADEVTSLGKYNNCDFCHRPMTFEEYTTHRCDGLGGKNPWTEKTKNAKWKVPGGRVVAKGHVIRPNIQRQGLWDKFFNALLKFWFR